MDKITLYDHYDPTNPLDLPMARFYKPIEGDLANKALEFSGIFENEKDYYGLWMTEVATQQMHHLMVSRKDLRKYSCIDFSELTSEEQKTIEAKARDMAIISREFSRLISDPNAGKGPEHFVGGHWEF